MNSKKIKVKEFFTKNGESIAQIAVLPENGKLRIYVAWENQSAAEDGFMGFFKSRDLYDLITPQAIINTQKFGFDIGHLPECKRIFKALF